MNLSNLKAIGLGLASGVLVLAFNNCAPKINGFDGSIESSSVEADNSKMPIVASADEVVSVEHNSGLVNSTASHTANKSLLEMFNQAKLYTSNSANGPFVENGDVCKGQASYYKMVGISAGVTVKGCASPAAALGCLDFTKHRSFTASELVGGNIVTVVTAAESNSYPAGDYAFYVGGTNQNTHIIHKVGTAKLKSCGTTTPAAPVAKSCQFRITNPEAVVGGGVNVYPFTCNEQTAVSPKTGTIYYRTGSSPDKPFNAICECK